MLFLIEQVNPLSILVLEIGIIMFNGLLSRKTPKRCGTYITLCLLYIMLIHRWVGFVLIAQSLLIGLLSTVTKIKDYKTRIENKRVEVNRDIVHIIAGILLMTIFYFEKKPVGIIFQILLIMGGIFAISITEKFKGKGSSGLIYRLERKGSTLGHGALWLALGSLFAVSFLNPPAVLAVFAAIFIADPLATIVGMYVRSTKLPYNQRKSFAGTITYFVAAASIGYIFIGPYSILVGIVGAIVESLNIKIDDNFSVSIAATVLLYLLGI